MEADKVAAKAAELRLQRKVDRFFANGGGEMLERRLGHLLSAEGLRHIRVEFAPLDKPVI